MTRKDYELIADRFKSTVSTYSPDSQVNPRLVLKDMALAIAEAMENDNPRFQVEKFMQACGFTEVGQ